MDNWFEHGGSGNESTAGAFKRLISNKIRVFVDGDSFSDASDDPIWLLGVLHNSTAPQSAGKPELVEKASPLNTRKQRKQKWKPSRSTSASLDTPSPPPPSDPSTSDALSPTFLPSSSSSAHSCDSATPPTIAGWPGPFYHDFYSRIALTYRNNFVSIPCSASRNSSTTGVSGVLNSISLSMGRGMRAVGKSSKDSEAESNATMNAIGSSNGMNGKGLTSDTGWGCMLRTGQSLLANTLVSAHLGRDWRRTLPTSPDEQESFALYARILTLFFDTPSPLAPFSVHAFALHGKTLGKEVGEWFGPSTAAGAIKYLVNGWKGAGMGVVEGVDGTIYLDEVAATSCGIDGVEWSRPVLVLIGLRLGIDGVNPIYYDSVKAIFSLPQSVGIAGGRPSSSYYFVGSQANNLFYIDPHHPKPTVEMVVPEGDLWDAARTLPLGSESFVPSRSSTARPEEELSDSFVTVQPPRKSFSIRRPSATSIPPSTKRPHSSPPPSTLQSTLALPTRLADFFSTTYSDPVKDAEIRSYHCEKVRKMPLCSLDPSMLVGFLIRDEADWKEFRHSVDELAKVAKPIFAIADSPPAWMRRPPLSGSTSSRNANLPPPHPSASAVISSGGESYTGGFSEDEGAVGAGGDDWDNDSTGGDDSSVEDGAAEEEEDDAEWTAGNTTTPRQGGFSLVSESRFESTSEMEGDAVMEEEGEFVDATEGDQIRRQESWYSTPLHSRQPSTADPINEDAIEVLAESTSDSSPPEISQRSDGSTAETGGALLVDAVSAPIAGATEEPSSRSAPAEEWIGVGIETKEE